MAGEKESPPEDHLVANRVVDGVLDVADHRACRPQRVHDETEDDDHGDEIVCYERHNGHLGEALDERDGAGHLSQDKFRRCQPEQELDLVHAEIGPGDPVANGRDKGHIDEADVDHHL